MTRFTRVKSTHQRVETDSTPWTDLKETPAKDNSKISKKAFPGAAGRSNNYNNNKNGTTTPTEKAEGGGGKFKNPEGTGGGGGKFNKNKKNDKQNFKSKRRNNYVEPESANFTPVGEESKGYGQSKTVKIFGQFWVAPEDAKRLNDLAKKMQSEGISRKDILTALQGERRKAEKLAKRRRDKTCFSCRMFGHVLADCPKNKGEAAGGGTGTVGGGASSDGDICFKCGSTEHISRFCKRKGEKFSFASCFICSQSGHIARQCPKNTKGIYPAGGSCDECGSVAHLKKDCPDLQGRIDTNDDDPSAMLSRISNPFSSTEYEDIPEDESAEKDNSEEGTFKPKKSMKKGKRKFDSDSTVNSISIFEEPDKVVTNETVVKMLKPPVAISTSNQAPKKRRVKF